MKFKSILILFTVIQLVFGSGKGRLTIEENRKRLGSCGRDVPSSDRHYPSWISNTTARGKSTIRGFISSRHILTSSMLVLSGGQRWRKGGKRLAYNCVNESIEVPSEYLDTIRLSRKPGYPKITRGFLPKVCVKEVLYNFRKHYSPLILELDINFEGSTPCLNEHLNVDEPVNFYEFVLIPAGVDQRFHPISHVTNTSIVTKEGFKTKESGAFLVNFSDRNAYPLETEVLYGVKTMDEQKIGGNNIFFRVDWLYDSLCELVGICPKGKELTVEPITEATTTPEFSTTPEKTSEASTTPSTEPKISTDPLPISTSQLPEASTTTPTNISAYRGVVEEEQVIDHVYYDDNFKDIEIVYRKSSKGYEKSMVLLIFLLFLILK